MIWDDTGFLLSKTKYNENSIIAEVFTENYGKVSGIIFGGTSKKIKNYLQIGNKLFINNNFRSNNKLGYFKVEIYQALTPFYFDNREKLSCIVCAMNLVKLLTAESQKNHLIFDLLNNLFIFLKKENWIKNYIFWELELFKVLGYDLEFKNLVQKKIIDNQIQYITKSSIEKRIIPNFLVDKNQNNENIKTLLIALRLVGDYLEKTILKPNNMSQPISRVQFVSTINK